MFHVSEAMGAYIIFSVRLLQLLVPTDSGNAKASSSGTGSKYGSHAFLISNAKEE